MATEKQQGGRVGQSKTQTSPQEERDRVTREGAAKKNREEERNRHSPKDAPGREERDRKPSRQ